MPNQTDPNQAADTTNTPPVSVPNTDLPPLPDFMNVPTSPTPPETQTPPADDSSGSAAPSDLPPVVATPKKKFGGGKIIATILGLVLLVGGVGAGVVLTQQQQLFQPKAAGPCKTCAGSICKDTGIPGCDAATNTCNSNSNCGVPPPPTNCNTGNCVSDCICKGQIATLCITSCGGSGSGGGEGSGGGGTACECNLTVGESPSCSGDKTCVAQGTNGTSSCVPSGSISGMCANIGGGACNTKYKCNDEGDKSMKYCDQTPTKFELNEHCGFKKCNTATGQCYAADQAPCPSNYACEPVGSTGCSGSNKKVQSDYKCTASNTVCCQTLSAGTLCADVKCEGSGCSVSGTLPTGDCYVNHYWCQTRSPQSCSSNLIARAVKSSSFSKDCGTEQIDIYCPGCNVGGNLASGLKYISKTYDSDCGGGGETAQCTSIKAYDTSWVTLTSTQLSALSTGAQVNFCVSGSAPSGTFDKAQFTINGVQQPETTTVRPSSTDFCQSYTILSTDTTVGVTAKIHHSTLGWY